MEAVSHPRSPRRPRAVVIGGGFGGIAAVRRLTGRGLDVVLVDRHAYNTFNPLLYQVATATLNAGDVTWFLRAVRATCPDVRFVQGTVSRVDTATALVHLDDDRVLGYDYLVIATGVTANYFGVPGAAEHALPLYGRAQALRLRDTVFTGLEAAAALAERGEPSDLNMVVVGGGATGVETAGAFAELRNRDLPVTYPEVDTSRIRITLVEMGESVLAPFHPRMQRYAERALVRRGVEVRLSTAVRAVNHDSVEVEHDGTSQRLPADVVVWASGVTVPPQVATWGLPQGRGGRIEIDGSCRVRGLDNVFAVGDIAIDPQRPLPQVAQPAMQQGKHAAAAIVADLRGRTIRDFAYRDKGTMAVVGRAAAVAQIRFLPKLTGLPAWVCWVGLHVAMLLGYRNRLATLANLGARYLGRGSRNVIVGETRPNVVASTESQSGMLGQPISRRHTA